MTDRRRHDIVVFGATSFVGRILCGHLVDRLGPGSAIDWAMAGRSADKLAAVAEEVGADVEHIVADAHDDGSLVELCARARLVISTVGPYALHGSGLVGAVVDAGIDYCDLAGEPHWMRRMIDLHQARAVETGSRVVHACGFDSVPSDMGVWFLQQQAEAAFGEPCTTVSMGVERIKGSPSGGTVASMLDVMERFAADRDVREILRNPYALAREGDRAGPPQPNVTLPEYDNGLESWLAPFVMAATNTRIVFRTHSLLGHPWGPDFTYREAVMTGGGVSGGMKATALASAFGGAAGAAVLSPTRRLVRRLAPSPGEGPSPELQRTGYFVLQFHGVTATGNEIDVEVAGEGDPGYGSTSKMLAEAALTLSSKSHDDVGGGFWTPATALGDEYLGGLRTAAGVTFRVRDQRPARA